MRDKSHAGRRLCSERQPGEEEERVVVAGIAPEAVIIAVAAVEQRVNGILQAELEVGEGAAPGSILAERNPVSLDDENVAVRAPRAAAGDRRRGMEQGVGVAPGVLPAQVRP